MSARSDKDEDLERLAGRLGQHRGRRLILFLLLLGALAWGGRELWLRYPELFPDPSRANAPVAASTTTPDRPHVVRRPARKRAPKAVTLAPTSAAPGRPAHAALPGASGSEPTEPERIESARVEPARVEPEHAEPEVEPARAEPEHAEPARADLEPPQPTEQPAAAGNGEAIARAIAAEKKAAIQACYERELKRTPMLRGRVTVELDLAPPRGVEEVRVVDDLDRPAFTQCVWVTMRQVSFEALTEEVSIQLPFVLTPAAR